MDGMEKRENNWSKIVPFIVYERGFMRRVFYALSLVLVLFSSSGISPVKARQKETITRADFSGDVICLPGVYLTAPDMLPAVIVCITQMAKDGVVYLPSLCRAIASITS
jgi:hypothetical protein